jgi:GR25 family glycosyltransferase involved in LPS biosynthesis
MLNIGITYNPSDELFTSGSNQTSILLLELFQKLNTNVTLIDVKSSENEWWTNFPKPDNLTLTKLHIAKNLDLFIDIDGYINPSYRKSIAKKSVVFMRTFLQFSEMDGTVYPEQPYRPRDFNGISEIWCWDILNPPETIPSIQTLFSCPIRCVPFIWSSSVADFYSKNKSIKFNQSNHWNVHIAEKNTNNTSSSIIPLVAIRELHNKKFIDAKYKCHNMDKKLDNQFLKENVLNNIEISTLPVEFFRKQAFYEWLDDENVILFSHTRFLPIRIGLLNAIWIGLPVIHNSSIIQSIHPQLEKLSYFGNEITGICSRFSLLKSNSQEYYNALSEIRNNIVEKWSISNNLSKWTNIFVSFFDSAPSVKEDAPLKTVGKELVIAFSEMWGGFNWNNNFFTDALRQECKLNNLDISIKGVEYEAINYKPDVIIFGPFTNTTKKWKDTPSTIPKVFFSAENWGLPTEDGFALQLSPYRIENDKHMRLPTWMTFIDWFNDSLDISTINTDDNPNRMPLKLAMSSHSKSFREREDFCAFVVSNPISQFRNDTFKALDSYKRVNSGGELYNNIGGRLGLKYPGGGCGDIPKYDFFSKHKFSLSFENSQASGYITEKVLHAKMAGCVPLYWGDKDTDSDFVSGSFINLSQLSSPEQIIKVVQKLEENLEMCAKIAATPILNEEKKQKALNIISNMSKRLLDIMGVKMSDEKAKGIDKIFVINLDTRKDRLDNLIKAEPYLENNITRIPAVNGKTLKLNSFIYKMFKDNKFFWKKSVIGCFLSHLTTWTKIINEPGERFLILEDDVRFDKKWISTWNKVVEHIPIDAELLYLGGVLPPNRDALPSCLEGVNKYWSQIKPNNLFSPNMSLPIFHFCAYSYIITKSAAKKLLGFLTLNLSPICELDHFIGHPAIGLKKYILNPLITHCFQDEDTKYITSQFNDLQRTNDFDSDIWNNTESFTSDEIEQFKNHKNSLTVYHIDNNKPFEIYERKWLEEVLDTSLDFKPLTNLSSTVPDSSWFIVQRPHLDTLISYFDLLKSNNINFKVLHLSDELSKDSIDFYSYSNCKAVIRNYVRDDIPKLSHIVTIPLGFHHKGESSRRFDDRSIVWSFHGTNWFNRKVLLEPISSIVPNNCHFTDTWNDPKQTLENCYLGRLNNSKFCPILRGNNIETFRLYEALEAGTIPIYVRTEGDDEFWKFISKKLGLAELTSWENAVEFIKTLLSDTNRSEIYRQELITCWTSWKNEIKSSIQKLK